VLLSRRHPDALQGLINVAAIADSRRMLRSVVAMAVVTALFAGTLVGGLHHMGALDPAMLTGPKEDHPGAATYGWKTHSLPAAGFSIKLPPEWHAVSPHGKVVFQERDGKTVVATLTVVSAKSEAKLRQSATRKAFVRGDRVLTFATSERLAASHARIFEHAARSFHEL
jgi:hypothetical protein